jgi:8-oxo-dGTP diphosphatase
MTERFAVVPAAYVCLLRPSPSGTEVLLQLRDGTGYMDGHWAAAAAGHVERGETVFEAAVREAAEEVDVHDVVPEPLCAMHRTGATGDPVDERVDCFFTATSWSGEPRIVEPEKCADLRWFPLDSLPDPVVPHELSVLRALHAGRSGGDPVPAIVTYGF